MLEAIDRQPDGLQAAAVNPVGVAYTWRCIHMALYTSLTSTRVQSPRVTHEL